MYEERELLNNHSKSDSSSQLAKQWQQSSSLGRPRQSRRLWASDYISTFLCLLCFTLGMVTVFEPSVATQLGQVNQLIVIGFLLQLMAICTQKCVQYFLLLLECLWNRSSLQNYESIIQTDFLAPDVSLFLRVVILLYLALPLSLGVAYKRFIGGSAISYTAHDTGLCGMTGPPGTDDYGSRGLTLFVNSTLPWWIEPAYNQTYGFNLYVESIDRAALLDGPTTEHVSRLQKGLRPGEKVTLSMTVNATVADMVIDVSNSTKEQDLAYWYQNDTAALVSPREATDDFWNYYIANAHLGTDSISGIDSGGHLVFGMMVSLSPAGWMWNNSFIMTSRWNTFNNETFGTAGQGFSLYRQRYRAEWSITSSSATLVAAERVEDGRLTDTSTQNLIQSNYLKLADIYPNAFIEYDWKYAGGREEPPVLTPHPNATSDTVLAAAMLWSRLTSFQGLGNPLYNTTLNSSYAAYLRYPCSGTYVTSTPTLKASYFLAAILAVNPFILISTLVIRLVLLGGAPISKNFGIASVLAGIDPSSLRLLKGASYSGRLNRTVRLRFATSSPDEDEEDRYQSGPVTRTKGRITVALEDSRYTPRSEQLPNGRVRRKIVYE